MNQMLTVLVYMTWSMSSVNMPSLDFYEIKVYCDGIYLFLSNRLAHPGILRL